MEPEKEKDKDEAYPRFYQGRQITDDVNQPCESGTARPYDSDMRLTYRTHHLPRALPLRRSNSAYFNGQPVRTEYLRPAIQASREFIRSRGIDLEQIHHNLEDDRLGRRREREHERQQERERERQRESEQIRNRVGDSKSSSSDKRSSSLPPLQNLHCFGRFNLSPPPAYTPQATRSLSFDSPPLPAVCGSPLPPTLLRRCSDLEGNEMTSTLGPSSLVDAPLSGIPTNNTNRNNNNNAGLFGNNNQMNGSGANGAAAAGGGGGGNGAAANHTAPLPVGHQQDLAYLYAQIQELGGLLRSNRDKVNTITKTAEEVAKRANGTTQEDDEATRDSDKAKIRELEHELAKANHLISLYKHEQVENTRLIADYEDAMGTATEQVRNYCGGIESRYLAQRRHYNDLLQQEKDEHLASRLERDHWFAQTLKVAEMIRTAYRLRTEEWGEEYTIISGLQTEVRCLRRCIGMDPEKPEEETGWPYLKDAPLNDQL